MAQGKGRNNNSGSQQTGVNQTASLRISDIRSNYNYPSWFNNTLGYAEKGQISVQALQNAANNLLNEGHMTRKPQYNQGLSPTDRKRETEKILVDYYGDDITRLTEGHTMQEARLTTGMEERASIQNKIQTNTDSIQAMWDSLGQKADMSHTHAGGGGVKECEWWNIFCKMQTQIDEGFQGLGKLALIGGLAVGGIFLLKMRLGK